MKRERVLTLGRDVQTRLRAGHDGGCPPQQTMRESLRPDIRISLIFGYHTAVSKHDLYPMSETWDDSFGTPNMLGALIGVPCNFQEPVYGLIQSLSGRMIRREGKYAWSRSKMVLIR